MSSAVISRRGFGVFAASFLVLRPRFAWADQSDGGVERIVYVQPLSPAPSDSEIAFVDRSIRGFYNAAVRVLPATPMPKSAYYSPRQRYRAETLLGFLDKRLPEGGNRIIGVTAADISTTKGAVYDWGIMGLANMPGSSCVVSSFRCKRLAESPEHSTVRFGKTAVHELGHTFGLEHCQSRGCLLEDGGGSVLTTDREYDLCTQCRARLGARIVREPRAIPWPERR
jgi:archaemetzincin